MEVSEAPPLWLLDVDGVLNVNPGKPGWGAAPSQVVVNVGGSSYRLRWAPKLMFSIRALHRTGAVEIRWATSWLGETDLLARTFGLPNFEPAFEVPPGLITDDDFTALKQEAAAKALADGRRLIWTDDDAIPADWLNRPDFEGIALLIAPKSNRGLRREDLDAIEAFAMSANAR